MKRIVYNLAVFAVLGLSTQVFGQTQKTQGAIGINTNTPHATLEVETFDENGSSVEGVLIPRVTSERAERMGEGVANATLIFITDGTAGTSTTSLVNGKGFYYFDATDKKWQKVGGNSSGATFLNTIPTGSIRVVEHITKAEWEVEGTFGLVQTKKDGIELPDPANYIGKIIFVNNQYANSVPYDKPKPLNLGTIFSGNGHFLTAINKDGKAVWIVIAGA